MVVQTGSDRVRHSRRLVLELLASSVDLSLASPDLQRHLREYGARPERFGGGGAQSQTSIAGLAGFAFNAPRATVAQPAKIDNDLYVRDYSRCVLCYKCVEACGTDAQNTFAIAVAGRGFEARISTESDRPLPDSACVYCGNCIGVCPTGALMFKSEYDMRQAGTWDESTQTVTETICPYCGVGCTLQLHVQDNHIVRVMSPRDHDVTSGHLCIKGRFGWQFVQNR
jgi:predicted molibdopterin-dependent oxidoreductase YjgC